MRGNRWFVFLLSVICLYVSSCTMSSGAVCPCIVNSVEESNSGYRLRVISLSTYDTYRGVVNVSNEFYLWSNEQYSIGDTLKFVKRK